MCQLNRSAQTDADLVDVMIGLNLLSCVSRGPICQRVDYCFPKDKPIHDRPQLIIFLIIIYRFCILVLHTSTCKRPKIAQMCSSIAFMVNWLSSTMPQITLQFCSNQPLTVNINAQIKQCAFD